MWYGYECTGSESIPADYPPHVTPLTQIKTGHVTSITPLSYMGPLCEFPGSEHTPAEGGMLFFARARFANFPGTSTYRRRRIFFGAGPLHSCCRRVRTELSICRILACTLGSLTSPNSFGPAGSNSLYQTYSNIGSLASK